MALFTFASILICFRHKFTQNVQEERSREISRRWYRCVSKATGNRSYVTVTRLPFPRRIYATVKRASQRTDAITLSRSTSPIIGAKRSPANSRGQQAVRIGRTSMILASLGERRSARASRCRTRVSTAVSVARDVRRMPFVVSAISTYLRRTKSLKLWRNTNLFLFSRREND